MEKVYTTILQSKQDSYFRTNSYKIVMGLLHSNTLLVKYKKIFVKLMLKQRGSHLFCTYTQTKTRGHNVTDFST